MGKLAEFDDDTDLPLRSMPLPNSTGARGPIPQELNDDSDEAIAFLEIRTPMVLARCRRWQSGRYHTKTCVPDTNNTSSPQRILIYFQLDMCISRLP